MGGVTWNERFTGWLSRRETDFNQALLDGKQEGIAVSASVTLVVNDVTEDFAEMVVAVTSGWVECPKLERGGLTVGANSTFRLFVPAVEDGTPDLLRLRMRYRLYLRSRGGEEYVLDGFKLIENDPRFDSWTDTSTLFARIYRKADAPPDDLGDESDLDASGRREHEPGIQPPLATAVLRISPASFLRELMTFRGTEGSRWSKLKSIGTYQLRWLAALARAYVGAPVPETRPSFPSDRLPPCEMLATGWHRVPRKSTLEREIVTFDVPDLDFPLNLHHLRLDRAPDRPDLGPVLLVPGSGVRAELYYGQPVGISIAEYLLNEGYDVWVENWRASIDFPANSYTLDQAARFDHPAAVTAVLDRTAATKLKAVVHCQGSISFVMAAVAGFLTDEETGEEQVSHIVSSAVSLFIEVTWWTWLKQRVALPTAGRIIPWGDAQWGIRPQTPPGALFSGLSQLMEYPCGNVPCKIANFLYGAGWDVLLRHANLDPDVHEWSARELGFTPMTLIRQVSESSRRGHIIPAEPRDDEMPASYVDNAPNTDALFTFMAGDHNRMFRWQGQKQACEFVNGFKKTKGHADFVGLKGYGHLDTFWGKDAAKCVWPVVAAGLGWNGNAGTRPSKKHKYQPEPQLPRREFRLSEPIRGLRRRVGQHPETVDRTA